MTGSALDGNVGVRGCLPEWVRDYARSARSWVLSVGLGNQPIPALLEGEQTATKDISVVVPVHDSPEVTRRCLLSLERYGGEAEVIVVDDGSKQEATARLLSSTCTRNSWRLVRHEIPKGHSRASEAGVNASERAYVCLLNSDTVVTPASWKGVVEAFTMSVDIGIVGPSTSYTPTIQCVNRALHCRRYWTDEQIWAFAVRYTAAQSGRPLVDLPVAGGFAFFVRRECWDKLGGFDQQLPDYGNETDFCRRAKRMGFRIVWSRGSYIHHLGSESYGRTLGLSEIRRRCVDADRYMESSRK